MAGPTCIGTGTVMVRADLSLWARSWPCDAVELARLLSVFSRTCAMPAWDSVARACPTNWLALVRTNIECSPCLPCATLPVAVRNKWTES